MLIVVSVSEQILQIFPLKDLPPQPDEADSHKEQDIANLKDVQRGLLLQERQQVEGEDESKVIVRAGELYKRYRTEEELPREANAFFELAGM